MFFNHTKNKINNQYKKIEDEMDSVFGPQSDGYLLSGDLTDKDQKLLDVIINMSDEKKANFSDIFKPSAEVAGRYCADVQLRMAQVTPVLMSYINPRFFIGDSPGLGKTVMSAGAYAYYRLKQHKDGKPWGKVLVVTDSIHVLKFSQEWHSFGIDIVPLVGSKKKKALTESNNAEDSDGVIINWDGLKTNDFAEFWVHHHQEYAMAIFDETSKLLNDKSKTYQIADAIVNTYQGGVERCIFLNGTSFEKAIYDYFYQFKVLKPKLIPSKSFLDARYVVKEGKEIFTRGYDRGGNIGLVKRRVGEIVDYRNQDELRDRLRYYFIARTKAEFSDDIPEHSFILHGVEMTTKQKKIITENKNISLINSPATNNSENTLLTKSSPKLKQLLDYVTTIDEDRPLIYVYNKESQYTIAEELEKLGYRVGILNGDINQEKKNAMLDDFNVAKTLDILVFNITKAMNVPTSDRILFYDIPTMPSTTTQVRARIDRNNYEDKKFYDFFCYLDSPEMMNLVRLAYFREHHAGEFSGQKEEVYSMLVQQLHTVYREDCLDDIAGKFEWMEENNKEFKDIEDELAELLAI